MRCLVLLALLMVALPATAGVTTDLTAQAVSATGPSTVEGQLAALDADTSYDLPFGLTSLTIEADSIDVRIEHEDTNKSVAGVIADPEHWEESYTLQAAALAMQPPGEQPAIFAIPLAGGSAPAAELQADGVAGTAGADRVTQHTHLSYPGHQLLSIGTLGATTWAGDDVELTLRGDFLLTFWDFTLAGGGTSIASGAKSSDIVWPVQEWHDQQAYLVVHGGVLVLRMDALHHEQLHLEAAEASSSAAGFTLQDVHGVLALDGSEVQVAGDLEIGGALMANVQPAGDRVRAQVTGAPDRVLLDSMPVVAPAAGGGQSGAFLFLAAPALLGAFLIAGRRYSATRAFARIQAAMRQGDYGAVAALPRRLLRSSRYAPEAAVMQATAAIRLDRPKDAEAALDSWPARAYPWDRDFLRAHLHAKGGRWAMAADSLHACLAQAPQMAAAAAADPLLARLAGSAAPEAPAREGYT